MKMSIFRLFLSCLIISNYIPGTYSMFNATKVKCTKKTNSIDSEESLYQKINKKVQDTLKNHPKKTELAVWYLLTLIYIYTNQFEDTDPAGTEIIRVLTAEVIYKKLHLINNFELQEPLKTLLTSLWSFVAVFPLGLLDANIVSKQWNVQLGLANLTNWVSFISTYHGAQNLFSWWSKNKTTTNTDPADNPEYSYASPSKSSLIANLENLVQNDNNLRKSPAELKAQLEQMLKEQEVQRLPKQQWSTVKIPVPTKAFSANQEQSVNASPRSFNIENPNSTDVNLQSNQALIAAPSPMVIQNPSLVNAPLNPTNSSSTSIN